MTPPLTDEQLGDLLTETFAEHEHLADPDRAVDIATRTDAGHPRHLGRVVLGAAAAVALVAGGTTYALSRGSGGPAVSSGPPAAVHQPPLPPPQSDAANKAKATAAAVAALVGMPTYQGATASGPIGAFAGQGVSGGMTPGYTVTRTRWWHVPGTDAAAVARWYAGHPEKGFQSEAGQSVSSSSDGTTTVYGVELTQPDNSGLPPRGVTIEVDTVRLPVGVGVRVSALSVWTPARPRASYVQDATSIDVHVTHTTYGQTSHTTHESFTVSDPKKILNAEIAFDALEGTGPVVVSCPMMRDVYRDTVVFHTPTGDVAMTTGGGCVDVGGVARNGKTVGPPLAFVSEVLDAVGAAH